MISFIIFEINPGKTDRKKYLVIEFPGEEIDSNEFHDDLANRIDQCCESSSIVFEGIVSNFFYKQLFMIFSV